jgi:F0F1-type ATP synthase membrane subunit b/b'
LVILYTSLKYIFIPRLETSIEARKRKIESLMLDAEKLRIESDALNAKYSEEIKKIHIEAFNIHKQAIQEFDHKTSKELEKLGNEQKIKLEEFRQEIHEIKKNLDESIDKEVEKLLKSLINKVENTKQNSTNKEEV